MKGSKTTLKIFNCFSFFILFILLNFKIVYGLEQKFSSKDKVEIFFQNLKTLEADFLQVSPSGNISNGKVFLDLPGKLRINYKNPNDLLITCKGFWIVIQNRKLKTTNNIPLKQTPFSILLDNRIDFKNDNLIFDFTKKSGIIILKIRIKKNPKAGELILEFSENPLILKKWTIKNVLGEETTVLIQNAIYNKNLSYKIFFPDDFPEPEN